MKKLLIICSILLTSHITLAQWVNLGDHGDLVHMVSNNLGYSVKGHSGGTPTSGFYYNVFVTNNDWQSETAVDGGGGGGIDYTCCYILKLDFLNFSTGLRTFAPYSMAVRFEKTTDYGYSWQAFPGYVPHYINMSFVNDTLGYATSISVTDNSKGRIYSTTPNALTQLIEWDTLNVYDGSPIEFVSANTGFVVLIAPSGNYYVCKTTDFGVSWSPIFSVSGKITAINFPENGSVGYISTWTSEGVFRTGDGGDTWNPTANPATGTINAMDFLNNNCGYIAGSNGQIHKTMNGGTTWTTENSTVSTNLTTIKIVDPENAYCVDQNGVLLKNSNVLSVDPVVNPEISMTTYPNPAQHTIHFRRSDKQSSNMIIDEVRIYDNSGREVLLSTEEEVTISTLQPGMYYLTILSEGTSFTSKFTKI